MLTELRNQFLNIRHGHGASVVVRGRESRPHGEGRQFTPQYNKGKVREAL